jgi:hypothetical protein
VDTQKVESVEMQVKTRLDALFEEGQTQDVELGKNENSENRGAAQLRELRAVVLAIDWEITDSVMASLIRQIERVKDQCGSDQTVETLLKLLESLGKYIQRHKSRAHVDAIKVLNSAFEALEKVLTSDGITESEKKDLLSREVSRFRKLKKQIAKQVSKTVDKTSSSEGCQHSQRLQASAKTDPHSIEGLTQAVQSLTITIQAEFKRIRADLERIKQELVEG